MKLFFHLVTIASILCITQESYSSWDPAKTAEQKKLTTPQAANANSPTADAKQNTLKLLLENPEYQKLSALLRKSKHQEGNKQYISATIVGKIVSLGVPPLDVKFYTAHGYYPYEKALKHLNAHFAAQQKKIV